jgi:DNA anti-recombination protein RmuC
MPTLANLPPHIYVFAAILGTLFLSFLIFFFLPSAFVSRRLTTAIKRLEALKGKPAGDLDKIFEKSGVLEHLWQEYADTLHKQSGTDSLGQPVARLRSTMPAGTVFRPDILVDIPLRTDFFKHLPGLFTGIGIIGTFYGLLVGLQAFEVSENAIIVRNSLNKLLHGVWEAFLVSAAAITLAMVITFLEKLVVTHLYAKVEKIVQLLDALFESGAGEEYLARLVKATEASSNQTAGLLKGELRQMLAELSAQQIAAANAASISLGDRITASIEAGLKEPLGEIAQSLKGVRSDQESAVQNLLTSVLQGFSQQMKELFGNQIAGINGLQQETIQALQAAVVTLEQMASNVEAAGKNSSAAMADQLAESVAAAEARQRTMNDKMTEFIDQLRQAVSSSQVETQAKLQSTLDELSTRMGALIEGLSIQLREAADAGIKQQENLNERSQALVGQFGGKAEVLAEGFNRAVAEMKAAVLAMRNTTGEALSKMNNSADTLYLAAKDFAAAGQGVTATLEKSSQVANQLAQAAGSVSAASKGLSGMLADHQSVRDSIAGMVGAMQAIVEQARREASMSSDVITRIEEAAAKLVEAQKEADSYLARVSDVLGEAHQSFSDGMIKAVGEANRDFHQALSDSVKLLREGIQELEDTLGTAAGHA